MKKIHFYLLFTFISASIQAQKDRFTVVAEVGTGIAYHSNTYTNWGYHNIALGGEYRFHRLFSADAALRYQSNDGVFGGYSSNGIWMAHPFQRLRAVSLSLGPRLNVPLVSGMELSLAPRVGLVAQKIMQPILLNAELHTVRYYQPMVLPVADISLRWSLWLSQQTALDLGVNVFGTLGPARRMTVTREALNPLPDISAVSPEMQQSFEENIQSTGSKGAQSLTAGIRTRLGQKSSAKVRVAQSFFEWGILLGGQVNIPNLQARQQGSGFHVGLLAASPLKERWYLQVEPQLKYSSWRSAPVSFKDYIATPTTYGFAYKTIQLKGMTNFELPILFKFVPRDHGRHAWLLGARAALIATRVQESAGSSIVGAVGLNDFDDINYASVVRRQDLGISLGHEYALTPNLRFSVRYTQGIFDLTHDNFFKNSDTYTNSDVQMSLRYLLD